MNSKKAEGKMNLLLIRKAVKKNPPFNIAKP
jgi:hypothetical protein